MFGNRLLLFFFMNGFFVILLFFFFLLFCGSGLGCEVWFLDFSVIFFLKCREFDDLVMVFVRLRYLKLLLFGKVLCFGGCFELGVWMEVFLEGVLEFFEGLELGGRVGFCVVEVCCFGVLLFVLDDFGVWCCFDIRVGFLIFVDEVSFFMVFRFMVIIFLFFNVRFSFIVKVWVDCVGCEVFCFGFVVEFEVDMIFCSFWWEEELFLIWCWSFWFEIDLLIVGYVGLVGL